MRLVFFTLGLLTTLTAMGQSVNRDSIELLVNEYSLERDRKELLEFRKMVSEFANDQKKKDESLVLFMQSEISQMRSKLGAARVEIGKSKARITDDLNAMRMKRVDAKTKSQIRRDVRAMKDDQRDVKLLERFYQSEKSILKQFQNSALQDTDGLEMLEVFIEILEKDIQWTINEIAEDKGDLKKRPRY